MFELNKKDLKGGIIFIAIIISFGYLMSWNANRINQNNVDNNSDIVYNIGGGTYE